MLRRPAFSLIELLLVLAIISSLGIFTASFYSRFLLRSAGDQARMHLVSSINKARTYAVTGRRNSDWGVRFSPPVLTLFSGSSYAARDTAVDENITFNPNVTVSGISEIVFSRLTGLPGTTAVITLSIGSDTQNITVNSEGIPSAQ
ncbi:MAG: hypothetical protein UX87_C0033G0002 [Candidatus Amesbacteria bacterium GW2011_GWA1_47_16]|uniref:General secretion pathway GspH domain-containing protein n=4 Tax=Candidatus Amesiibacteriota TaxID=1752730 RepID=A0A0G1UAX2_9BACT|nr:MAG: hypothetical protein UX87_C0033G0002 [Candidatus Amesbacteria bacterium GW2011_GWA1_47_16]KKU63278.1 MAG: hypothetical protein UX86_C0028G0004 [Candidatus Amesbacteria bacterium GW2011_GWC1_47_15]KKU95488.1 MAG: hypothetical protein UY28_C0049G0002 [Candidatus Amesbacteria bacterium GW2011_GWB1_48_13]OGC99836.1 MAG: hypothetical protein A2972_05095 [Candidatus Amesbacteria bacterium RIFCSPLOWO2_01_FULL_47_33]